MKRSWDGVPVVKEENVIDVQEDIGIDLNVEADSDDPPMCGAYASDIYEYLRSREREAAIMPSSNYIEQIQRDEITAEVRGAFINWLVSVADAHNLQPDTLFSAVSYFDRYLSVEKTSVFLFEVLMETSLVIAWKYDVRDYQHGASHAEMICPFEYFRRMILKMEGAVLKALKFELGNPTTETFLWRFTRIAQGENESQNLQFEFLCNYIAELSLLDYACLQFLPSLVAASAVFLSRFTLQPDQHPWSSSLQQYSRYSAADLKECVLLIHDLQLGRRESDNAAIRLRYEEPKFERVATLASLPQIPESFFRDIED